MLWAAVAFGCWLAGGLAGAAPAEQAKPRAGVREVEIAIAAPFSGQLNHLGRDIARGAQMAIDEANASGLRIEGAAIRLTLREYDDQADPRTGARIGAAISVSDAVAVIGHLNSGVSIPAAGFYHQARLVQVTPASTNPRLTQLGFDTVFRLPPSDEVSSRRLGEFAADQLAVRRALIVSDDSAYGRIVGEAVASGLAARGAAIVDVVDVTEEAPNATAVVEAVRKNRPDVVVLGGMDTLAEALLPPMRTAGLTPVALGGDGMCSEKLAAAVGFNVYCYIDGAEPSREFVDRFRARFGSAPDAYAAAGYDAATAIVAAIRAAGSVERSSLVAAMRALDAPGLTGRLRFDKVGDRPDARTSIFRYDGADRRLMKVVP